MSTVSHNRFLQRREEIALAAYQGGATYQEIADQLGLTLSGARSLTTRAIRNTFDPPTDVDAWRKDRVALLDSLIDRLWPAASDPRVAQTIIRAIDKQGDLMGVAKIVQNDQTVTIEHVRTYRDQIADRLQVIQGELQSTTTPHDS